MKLKITRELEMPSHPLWSWAVDEYYTSSIGHSDKELAKVICRTEREAVAIRKELEKRGWLMLVGERYELTLGGRYTFEKLLAQTPTDVHSVEPSSQ